MIEHPYSYLLTFEVWLDPYGVHSFCQVEITGIIFARLEIIECTTIELSGFIVSSPSFDIQILLRQVSRGADIMTMFQ